jgi:hypothetical protein
MLKLVKTATLSAMVGLGAMAAAPSSASAEPVGIFWSAQDAGFGFYFGESARPVWRRGYRHERHDRRERWHRQAYCSTGYALRKAERLGFHRARISRITYRTISVRGHVHGRHAYVRFARAPHCPILR